MYDSYFTIYIANEHVVSHFWYLHSLNFNSIYHLRIVSSSRKQQRSISGFDPTLSSFQPINFDRKLQEIDKQFGK